MRMSPLLASVLLLAGCNPPPEEAAGESAPAAAAASAAGDATSSESPAASPTPEQLALVNTAWRVSGEDGATYTTMFDADGQYRDLKNGEPWQQGGWERLADGRLCFEPSDETRAGACWTLGEEKQDGKMRARSDTGREIELQQVTYIAPLAQTGE